VLGVVQAFDELRSVLVRPVLVRRGDELQTDSGIHDGVRAGLAPKRLKNVSFRGCIRRPWGDASGPTVVLCARAACC
jgi:hypothetical protein